jgi:hypothetical protein
LTEHHNTILIDGRGQANEGLGHDAFAGVPYERLNAIRLSVLTLSSSRLYLRGDATSAYEPERGLRRFVREFEYVPDKGFTIWDNIETLRPSLVTSVIHADSGLDKEAHNRFSINRQGTKLIIELVEPPAIESEIKINTVTAAGPPGAVDKGERQERGQKLLLTTPRPVQKVRFLTRLKVQNTRSRQIRSGSQRNLSTSRR